MLLNFHHINLTEISISQRNIDEYHTPFQNNFKNQRHLASKATANNLLFFASNKNLRTNQNKRLSSSG